MNEKRFNLLLGLIFRGNFCLVNFLYFFIFNTISINFHCLKILHRQASNIYYQLHHFCIKFPNHETCPIIIDFYFISSNISNKYKFVSRVVLMSLRNVGTGHWKVTVSDMLTSWSSTVESLAALVDLDLVSCCCCCCS